MKSFRINYLNYFATISFLLSHLFYLKETQEEEERIDKDSLFKEHHVALQESKLAIKYTTCFKKGTYWRSFDAEIVVVLADNHLFSTY